MNINMNGSGKVVIDGREFNGRNVGNIKTGSGGVECGNVSGNITTGSGDVDCEDVGGNIRTGSGDVVRR